MEKDTQPSSPFFSKNNTIVFGLSVIYLIIFSLCIKVWFFSFSDTSILLKFPFIYGSLKVFQVSRSCALLWGIVFLCQSIGLLLFSRLKVLGRKVILYFNIGVFLVVLVNILSLKSMDGFSWVVLILSFLSILFPLLSGMKDPFYPINSSVTPGSLSSKKKILIVDDDKGLLKMIRATLLLHGYHAITVTTGEKGLQIARSQKPDLIVLDVLLPGIKGREVCTRLKDDSLTRDIPVIFLTAKDSPDDVRAEMEAGAISHLTKPINPRTLVLEINKILGV